MLEIFFIHSSFLILPFLPRAIVLIFRQFLTIQSHWRKLNFPLWNVQLKSVPFHGGARSIAHDRWIAPRLRGAGERPRRNALAYTSDLKRDIYARDAIERGVAAREPVGQRFCVHLQLTGLSADCARRNRRRTRVLRYLLPRLSLLHVSSFGGILFLRQREEFRNWSRRMFHKYVKSLIKSIARYVRSIIHAVFAGSKFVLDWISLFLHDTLDILPRNVLFPSFSSLVLSLSRFLQLFSPVVQVIFFSKLLH